MITHEPAFLDAQTEIGSYFLHLEKLVGALGTPEHPASRETADFLTSTLGAISVEMSLYNDSPKLIYPTLGSLSEVLGRLCWMNRIRSNGLREFIESDNLQTNSSTPEELRNFKRDFPKATTSLQILSLKPVVREIFYQWQSGKSPSDFRLEREAFYQAFEFTDATTSHYTDQDALRKRIFDNLSDQLEKNPLPANSRVTIIGTGPSPFELKVIQDLIRDGKISVSQIDGVDMQTAEALGIKGDFPQGYAFHGGHTLEEWAQIVKDDPSRKSSLVFFCGSVDNNEPDLFQQTRDMFHLSDLLQEGGILVYDTHSFDASPTHIEAFKQLLAIDPHAPVGARRSTHLQEFFAYIFPDYLIKLRFQLANLDIVAQDVWQVSPEVQSRNLVIGRKRSATIAPMGQLMDSLIRHAYDVPSAERRPSPVALAIA